ncbi:MAG: acyltransferase [Phototrophicales bacterium]|nr:MAG: acyltransferase [Phototrophicales bacterium]RMG77142.1 MAG: acyltransferase [Chloroflexota bacterium]
MPGVISNLKNNYPVKSSRLLSWIGRLYFRLAGWRLEGEIPNEPKLVIIAAPHTSNWDGWHLVMASWAIRLRCRWMVKKEFMRVPLVGLFIRLTGGLPINRQASHNAVKAAVDAFKTNEHLILVIAPEGTRSKLDHWKTGFYFIAKEANVPLLAARMDYGRKVIDFITPEPLTGDLEHDIEVIWNLYRPPIRGLYPENQNDFKLRPRDIKRGEELSK